MFYGLPHGTLAGPLDLAARIFTARLHDTGTLRPLILS
jgi:hypothetical protein